MGTEEFAERITGSIAATFSFMPSTPTISVVICTRDRAAALEQTLRQLALCRIPSDWKVEGLVVDNGSTDNTAAVVKNAGLKNLRLEYLYESKKGLSHARNAALAAASGDIILFTDDDVQMAEDWIERLATPLVSGQCDAATGQVTLAPELIRPWMGTMHKGWIASSAEAQPTSGPVSLIGANMGFRRAVLDRVPLFDTDLGAGALGSSEDTLFGWQLAEAGFRIQYVPDARIIHYPDPSRFRRMYWLGDAAKRGRTKGYLFYHWEHTDIAAPHMEWLSYWLRLQIRRRLQPPPSLESEGCPPWELSYVLNMEKCRQFCRERQRARHYTRRGLRKQALEARPSTGRELVTAS